MSDSISAIDTLRDLVETLLLILERPVVWAQLGAFLIIIVATDLLLRAGSQLMRPIGQRGQPAQEKTEEHTPFRLGGWLQRLIHRLSAIHYTIFPLLCIGVGEVAVRLFRQSDWPYGLLAWLVWLFWLLLAYRIVVALLFSFLHARQAKAYNRRFITPLFLLFLLIVVDGADGGTFTARQIVLFTLLDAEITVGRLLTSALVFYLFQAFAWIVRDIFQSFILPTMDNERKLGNTVVGAAYYAIVAIGVLIALGLAGFNIATLAVIFGGLSVGIGFGLQDLVANFISGMILLIEQTLRPGDVIEINGKRGTVQKMSVRATVMQSVDNIETFIPNKTFLTSQFSTLNYTSPISRHALRVSTSYNSDPNEVRDILVKLADRHGLILKKPAPAVFFSNFGDSSLEFELAIHMDKPARVPEVLSDLRYMIWREFREHNIEIPYPQRDIHIRSEGPATQSRPDKAKADSPT